MIPMNRGPLASSFAAVVSVLAAISCCLPLGPFLLAAGFAGASGVFLSLQPYLIGFAVLMLIFGSIQAFRTRRCGRRRVALNVGVLVCSTGLVAAMLFSYAPGPAPAGQPAVSTLRIDSFRRAFNDAAGQTRVVALLSPT
jgi:hypothetical protein